MTIGTIEAVGVIGLLVADGSFTDDEAGCSTDSDGCCWMSCANWLTTLGSSARSEGVSDAWWIDEDADIVGIDCEASLSAVESASTM
jgi:hypothetical protein